MESSVSLLMSCNDCLPFQLEKLDITFDLTINLQVPGNWGIIRVQAYPGDL